MDPAFFCEFCGGYMGDEDKKPLVLCCGHTFCTPCIYEFFRVGKYKCPTCSYLHHSKNVKSIPVNYTLLEIIKAERYSGDKKDRDAKIFPALSKKSNSNNSKREKRSQITLPDYKIENAQSFKEPLPHAGRCDNHDMYCTFWCKSCKDWICHDCTATGHPPLQCEILPFDQALGELMLEGDLCIKKTIKLFDNHAEKYYDKQLALRVKKEKNSALFRELKRLISKHQKAKRDVERQSEAIKSCLADGFSTLLTLLVSQEQLLEAQTLEEVLSARHRAQICQSKILDWCDPNIMLFSEEMSYSEELQKSTFVALAVLEDLISSDDSQIKSTMSGFTALSIKDEADVARDLKYLLETSQWKKIILKIENKTDDTGYCLSDRSCRTYIKQCDLVDKNHNANAVQNEQIKANPSTNGKLGTLDENLSDLTTEERGFSSRCSFPCLEYLKLGGSKQLEYLSKHMQLIAKGEVPFSPQVDKISECGDSLENLDLRIAGREEEKKENRKQPRKYVVAQEEDDFTLLLTEGTACLEKSCEHHVNLVEKLPECQEINIANNRTKKGDHSEAVYETLSRQIINNEGFVKTGINDIYDPPKKPSEFLPAVMKAGLTYSDLEESFHENSHLKYSKNEIHRFHKSFENMHQNRTGKECGDPRNARLSNFASGKVSNSLSEVIRTLSGEVGSSILGRAGCPLSGELGSSVSGETGSIVSGRKSISASGNSNIVPGRVIVIAGEADEDDDDDESLSTNEYMSDTILSFESEEIERDLERPEWRCGTGGILLLEGGESHNVETLIQGGNKEQIGATVCRYKGLDSNKGNETSSALILISGCKDRNYDHIDGETKTVLSGYQRNCFIATDSNCHIKKKAHIESGYNDKSIFPHVNEFGVEHYPVGSNVSAKGKSVNNNTGCQEEISVANADEEARESEIAHGIESDTTLAIGDLDGSEINYRCTISELYGDNETKIIDAGDLEVIMKIQSLPQTKAKFGEDAG